MRRREARLLIPILLLLPWATAASAQPVTDEKKLLQQGTGFLLQHDDELALIMFQRAYNLRHSAQALAQMSVAEGALGRWLSAEAHLETALAGKGDDWVERHRPQLQPALVAIGQHLGDLDVATNVPGAAVSIDKTPVGTTPLPKPFRGVPGIVSLEVSAPGYVTVTRSSQIIAGVRSREVVDLSRVAAAENKSTEPAPSLAVVQVANVDKRANRANREATSPTGFNLRRAGIAIAVVGVALIAGGATSLAIAGAQAQGTQQAPTLGDHIDGLSTARTIEGVGAVMMGIGAAAAIGGIVMIALPSGKQKTSLWISPTGNGVRVTGRF